MVAPKKYPHFEDRQWYTWEKTLFYGLVIFPKKLAAQPKLVRVAATTALFGLALCCVPAFLSFLALLPVLARLQMGELPKPRGPHAVSFVDVELPIGGDLDAAEDTAFDTTVRVRIFYPTTAAAATTAAGRAGDSWLPESDVLEYGLAIGRFVKLPGVINRLVAPVYKLVRSSVPQNLPLLSPVEAKVAAGAGAGAGAGTSAGVCGGKSWPLHLFSHGLGGSVATYSVVCAELASHGAVVLAMEHKDGSAVHTRCVGNTPVPYTPPTPALTGSDGGRGWRQRQLRKRRGELCAIVASLRWLASRSSSDGELVAVADGGGDGDDDDDDNDEMRETKGTPTESSTYSTSSTSTSSSFSSPPSSSSSFFLQSVPAPARALLATITSMTDLSRATLVGHSFGGAAILSMIADKEKADAKAKKSGGGGGGGGSGTTFGGGSVMDHFTSTVKNATTNSSAQQLKSSPSPSSSCLPPLDQSILSSLELTAVVALDPWMLPLPKEGYQRSSTATDATTLTTPTLLLATQSLLYPENFDDMVRFVKARGEKGKEEEEEEEEEEEVVPSAPVVLAEGLNLRHQDQSDVPCTAYAAARLLCMASDRKPADALAVTTDAVVDFLRCDVVRFQEGRALADHGAPSPRPPPPPLAAAAGGGGKGDALAVMAGISGSRDVAVLEASGL